MHRPSPREIIMAYKLTWLADVLRAAGCTVVEEDGWKDRGRGQMGNVLGVMQHHTGPGSEKGLPELIRDGRPDVAGPLSQLFLPMSGVFHVIAAGRKHHGGYGTRTGQNQTELRSTIRQSYAGYRYK